MTGVAELHPVGRALMDAGVRVDGDPIRQVIDVAANPASSRSRSTLLGVRTRSGHTLRLLAKEGSLDERTDVGDPWGVAYEATIYTTVLSAAGLRPSPFVTFLPAGSGRCWLVLRWLDDARDVARVQALIDAAGWLGAFHRRGEVGGFGCDGLVDYRRSVRRWADLALRVIEACPDRDPRLGRVVGVIDDVLGILAAAPLTIVHGDFYPPNVLCTADSIVPVDWEWAGVGAGEIDLAALTEGWDARTVQDCVATYRAVRGSGDGGHPALMAAARVYLALRGIGGRLVPGDPLPPYWVQQLVDGCDRVAATTSAAAP